MNVNFSYPTQADVLQQINLQVKPGERLGIIGHNGCGKTTLFLLISGVLTPTTGHIYFADQPVVPGRFYPEMGLIFQNPDDQLFSSTVWEDVAFAPQNLGCGAQEVAQRVKQALMITGTQALAERPPHHLSGGEKRMVAIASILAMQPQLILYDEPTANLDLRTRRQLIQFFHQSPITSLISSHDLEFVLEVCDRVVLMAAGQIVAVGIPQTILGDAALMAEYELEQPASLRCSATACPIKFNGGWVSEHLPESNS